MFPNRDLSNSTAPGNNNTVECRHMNLIMKLCIKKQMFP